MKNSLYKIDNFTARAYADRMHKLCFDLDTGAAENLLIYIESYGLLSDDEFKTLKNLLEKSEELSEGNIGQFDRKQLNIDHGNTI